VSPFVIFISKIKPFNSYAWKAGILPTELLPQNQSYFSPKILSLCQRINALGQQSILNPLALPQGLVG